MQWDVVLGCVIILHWGLSHFITPKHCLKDHLPFAYSLACELPFQSPLHILCAQWAFSQPVLLYSSKVKSFLKWPSGHPSHSIDGLIATSSFESKGCWGGCDASGRGGRGFTVGINVSCFPLVLLWYIWGFWIVDSLFEEAIYPMTSSVFIPRVRPQ